MHFFFASKYYANYYPVNINYMYPCNNLSEEAFDTKCINNIAFFLLHLQKKFTTSSIILMLRNQQTNLYHVCKLITVIQHVNNSLQS